VIETSMTRGSVVASIHPTAVVDPQAEIASGVSIGPFCVIEPGVVIDTGCRLAGHVVVKRGTRLGKNNVVCEGAVLGGRPQHLHAGERVGKLQVGEGNTIRENATIHCGLKEGDVTVVGDGNFIMVNAHIAHDCQVGNHTIIVNNAMIAGHVVIEDRAYISGAVGVHQFCRIGKLAMVSAHAHLPRDVPPFVTVDGVSSHVVGLNLVGLRRNGYTDEAILQLKSAYRIIYRSGLTWGEILATLQREYQSGPAAAYYEFLRHARRGIMQERRGPVKSTIRIFPKDDHGDSQTTVRTAS
jgi:UDP-N-acetylglucosamine acyltransferase